jgi:tetratricopeptide (TPR) repeat protein
LAGTPRSHRFDNNALASAKMPVKLAGMNTRFGYITLFALVVAAVVAPCTIATSALAQNAPEPHEGLDPHEGLVKPPDELPKIPRGERNRNIDFLFGALKVAPDDASAKAIEDRIWAVWTGAGTETTNLLMSRAKKAIDDNDYDLALRVLNAIIEIKPDFTEAWNRRATVYFMKRDYTDSLADISKVLAREPRHFGALSGLGLIMQEIGDDKHALEAYRKALDVHPHLKGISDKVKSLKEKVEGRDI